VKLALAITICLFVAPRVCAQPAGVGSQLRSLSAAEASAARMHPAVARIVAPGDGSVSYGSGTLVHTTGDYGLVVTNWHVVNEAAGPISVHFPDGFYSLGTIQNVDRDWDLAVIAIRKPNAQPVRIADRPPQPGEMLTIAGYGSGQYREATGPCTQYVAPGLEFPYEMVELAASARQGDSGGPIFNSRGELAGVLFGEGNGRTSGSYCGRVRWFLTSIVPPASTIGAGTTLAATAPATQSPATQSPAVQAIVERPLESIPARPANASPQAAPIPGASNMASQTLSRTNTPFVQNASQVVAPEPAVSSPPVASTQAGPDVIQIGWHDIAGESLADQAKTVLAAVGVLAVVLQALKLLSREAPAAK
jgi:hypothetical protein